METIRRNWRGIILIFLGWTLFALFFSAQIYFNYLYVGKPDSFSRIVAAWLVCSYLWALMTPLALWLARRFPIERKALARRLATHLLLGSSFSLIQIAVYILASQFLLGGSSAPLFPLKNFQSLLVSEFHFNLLLYLVVVGLYQAFDYYRRFREREQRAAQLELEAAQLETQLTRARLDALKMQLHPHFLFNTLNSISVLMRDGDITAANQMLVRLSELLRVALKSGNAQEVSLKEELEFLRGYLEIEQIRFEDRLTIDFEIEPETLFARVPNLILQPLVENAIRHGIAPLAEAGKITIQTRRQNGFVELSVGDNGAGIDKSLKIGGIGLKNTRERLEKLYGEKQKFEITTENGDTRARISIPFRIMAE